MPKSPNRAATNALEQVYARDRAEWRAWLAANHSTSPGIWLVFDKKSSRADRLAYGDAVEEGLCFGWIDSTVRTLDDARYLQLFTPRKPKSTWSRPNKERVERLIAQGLMSGAGLAAIELAKANGAWTSLDAVDAMVVPDDLATALKRAKGAAANFAAFAPSARKGYLHWISQAVRPETRALRVAEVARRAAANARNRFLAAPRVEPAQTQTSSPPKKSAAKKSATRKLAAKKSTTKRSAITKPAGKRKSR
jgi:uncharacterized protein YdeI (YjbR/CyaY-like superfamily)